MSKLDLASERKNQIVSATVECITRFGYHNFSMQDVAKAAGVSKGIIHYYFLNKDDLMLSVLERVIQGIENILQSNLEGLEDPVKKLKIFIELCADIVKNTKEYYQVSMDFWTQITQKSEVKEIISTHYERSRETCRNIIEEGIVQGVFKEINAHDYSLFIIASIDGMSLQWLFDKDSCHYDQLVSHSCRWLLAPLLVEGC